ncbi:MAG: MaoC family dehydratase N-terminal domain-containing protein [Mesorhizobium sp.]
MTDQTGSRITAEVRDACEAFVGNCREVEDTLAPEPAEKLAILLGDSLPDDHLPPTYHWCYFSKGIPAKDIGADMHEKTGIFLPAVPFPRRMWAASEVSILQPLKIGEPARRRSTVTGVAFKEGKTGPMCFVTVSHEIEQDGAPCVSEKQTVVYRDRGTPEKALRQAGDPVPEGYFTYPDSQLWFYSAVTHNGHRIHWDREFCRDVEGYADLVVHGPLMATQLCEAMRNETLKPMRFTFRAQASVLTTTPVRIVTGKTGDQRHGEIQRSDGVVSMAATLSFF